MKKYTMKKKTVAKQSGTAKKRSRAFNLSVLFSEIEGCWAAQCLEYDIAAQANSLPDLYQEMERMLIGYVVIAIEKGMEPFAGVPKPPAEYRKIFEQSKRLALPPHKLDLPAKTTKKPKRMMAPIIMGRIADRKAA